ncbi:MAG: preprotein translocase subunit YajC [Oscillospiraceae bacterium]|jgi:preprotein translocase subunit YajC|nr:preprotein translocase subunit YajC [Oscillospiraceae bacterium]
MQINQSLVMNLICSAVIGATFIFFSRSQSKKRKNEEEMRKSLKIGDEIITVGGIIGKIVSLRSDGDSIVIESGTEKIKIKRWAVSGFNVSEIKS